MTFDVFEKMFNKKKRAKYEFQVLSSNAKKNTTQTKNKQNTKTKKQKKKKTMSRKSVFYLL